MIGYISIDRIGKIGGPMTLLEHIHEIEPELIAHRRYLHEHPEIGMSLENTVNYVESTLKTYGYEPVRVGKMGVRADLDGAKKGKTLLLRGDMDALPIEEETGLPFQSQNGHMHACGHDFHTAMLLGAAKILKKYQGSITGHIVFMFQPAEEIIIGALDMIDHGILTEPPIDMAYMIHLFPDLELPAGTLILPKSGASTLAADWFDIEIEGKGGHGAMPHTTVDPITIATHIQLALTHINAREVHPTQTAIVSTGSIHAGTVGNIIPDRCVMKGTIRTYEKSVRTLVHERICSIAEKTADVFNGKARVRITEGCPAIINSEIAVEHVYHMASTYMDNQGVIPIEEVFPEGKILFSEDFAYITERCEGSILLLSAGNRRDGYCYPLHHPKVLFDEQILVKGVRIFTSLALDYLSEPSRESTQEK